MVVRPFVATNVEWMLTLSLVESFVDWSREFGMVSGATKERQGAGRGRRCGRLAERDGRDGDTEREYSAQNG